jgi:hypothetical protein
LDSAVPADARARSMDWIVNVQFCSLVLSFVTARVAQKAQ